jgi:hypothetical protein
MMDDKTKLAVYAAVAGPVEDLEWSGSRQGQGYGPHGSGNDGPVYKACPVCRGLEKPNGDFIASAVGHQPGCVLAALLGSKTRPLARGEQGVIAL